MRLTFICDHKSRPMPRKTARNFGVGSMAWCTTCHDLRQVTKSVPDARVPKPRGL